MPPVTPCVLGGVQCRTCLMKPERQLVTKLFQKLAPRVGARIVIEPDYGFAGQIVFKNGTRRYFRGTSLDLNTLGASEVAQDKDYANFFMKKMGYPTVPGRAFYSDKWASAVGSGRNEAAAYRYARRLGFPVMVKPNSKSKGVGVTKVFNKSEFERAVRFILTQDRIFLVQRVVSGKDYRIVVLDSKIISAYERVPLTVIGDGRSSIRNLLARKQKSFIASGRDTVISADDFRIKWKLKRLGLGMNSIIPKGTRVELLDNSNLSCGGDSVDVTAQMHPEFRKIAIKLTRDMGLRLCGVDLMIDGDITQSPNKYWVLEINSAPGLDHYFLTGAKQEKVVEDLYLAVLEAMAQG